MSKEFNYLKKEFPKIYRNLVLEHKAVNKVIIFCKKDKIFIEVSDNGKGISEDLETYFVNYLAEKYNSKAFARAAAYVLEDQTTFIGFDIKTVDNEIWSQQNIFNADDEGKL